jgi:tetratricopeptide (TPR) repeat protein
LKKAIIITATAVMLIIGVVLAVCFFGLESDAALQTVRYERPPTVLEVPPQDMRRAFVRQYRPNPDRRFTGAFCYLIDIYNQQTFFKPFKMKLMLPAGAEDPLVLILKKTGREVGRVRLPLPLTFAAAVDGLNQWLSLLEQNGPALKQKKTVDSDQLETADNQINYVDQRKIVSGLVDLENLWQDARDPLILKSAVRAYGLLLLTLVPDKMDESDPLAACGLAYLGLAAHMNPELVLNQEEALLAAAMGYRRHALGVIADAPEASDYTGKCLRAFLVDDFKRLEHINTYEWHALGHYLLARTYRHLGLDKEAQTVLEKMFRLMPASYPNLVELIFASQVGRCKLLTILFPLDLLGMMEVSMMKDPEFNSQTWRDRISAVEGESGSGISLSGFEDMLRQWKPLSGRVRHGFLISTDRVKTIFRILYANAIYLRFDLLFNKWGVPDKTRTFVENLLAKDAEHPLVMSMLARITSDLGENQKSEAIAEKLLTDPDCPAGIAMDMYGSLNDLMMKIKLLPSLAAHFDSRPYYTNLLAYALQTAYYYDQSRELYQQVLAANPNYYGSYTNLVDVAGSDRPIRAAVEVKGDNYAVQAEAGDFFFNKNTAENFEQALACYEKAISLLPDNYYLYQRKAVILRKLGKYQAAIETMKPFVGKFRDLTDVFVRCNMAKTYLAMGDTEKALAILDYAVNSYQAGAMMLAADIYTVRGQRDKAREIIEQALKRYPTTACFQARAARFCWENKQPEKAADFIASGGNIMPQFSTWFFDDFFHVFTARPEADILRAVGFLQKAGIDNWHLGALAARFAWCDRCAVALKINALIKERNPMARMENLFSTYSVLRQWKGKAEARQWLLKKITGREKDLAGMIIMKSGEFDLMKDFVSPGNSPPQQREFNWLMRLVGWLGSEKRPASSAAEFERHYRTETNDYYFAIGRYLLGMKSEAELLEMVSTAKQRCEFSYYIGLKYRLEGDFQRAAEWYAVCLETLQKNNGEYHWAGNELFWWAKMGIERRHRRLSEDMALGHAEDVAEFVSAAL